MAMSRDPLSAEAIELVLRDLSRWRFENDRLCRRVVLGDFREAVAFMVRVAFEAEQRNHHPEITNVYNRVDIALTTHDAGNKVTLWDVELAGAIEQLLGK